MARLALVLALVLLIAPLHADTELPPIKIWTYGTVGTAPLSIRVRITIEPHSANRWACLYAVQVRGGAEEITHCWEVAAEKEPRTNYRNISRMGAGRWDVVAALLRNDGKSTLSNRYTIVVTGWGYEPDPNP